VIELHKIVSLCGGGIGQNKSIRTMQKRGRIILEEGRSHLEPFFDF